MSWIVYVAHCADNSLYTGVTNNLDKRIKAHNNGTGAKYTRSRRPIRIVYTQSHPNRSQAQSREMQIKRMSRAQKLKLMRNTSDN